MIKGFIGTSLVDYPGKVASVIFTGGCNLRCPFCYNVDLVLPERLSQLSDIPEEEILKKLKNRKGFVDGVVFTGGEPLLHKDFVKHFIPKVKELGFFVKIDTNGMFPERLRDVLPMVDFVAVDVKATPQRYPEFGGVWEKVKRSIELLKTSEVDYEVRITAVPVFINEESLKEIGPKLEGVKRVVLQKFVNTRGTLDPSFQGVHPYTKQEMEELAKLLRPYVKAVLVR